MKNKDLFDRIQLIQDDRIFFTRLNGEIDSFGGSVNNVATIGLEAGVGDVGKFAALRMTVFCEKKCGIKFMPEPAGVVVPNLPVASKYGVEILPQLAQVGLESHDHAAQPVNYDLIIPAETRVDIDHTVWPFVFDEGLANPGFKFSMYNLEGKADFEIYFEGILLP